jgi:hypothetical protein
MATIRPDSTQAGGEQRAGSPAPEAVRQLIGLEQPEELADFGRRLAEQGFTTVRRFLEEIREYLRTYMDEEAEMAATVVQRALTALPTPGRISPSWQNIWQELQGIVRYKQEVLRSIPPETRSGEWQVLLDNPYSHQHIAVYPGLTFQEAAYMYAYFRTDLEPNEYIRLQKVETVIFHTGADG